ncbi:hypothetical protein D915_004380 [Fasciola hepatica]|uniref:Uncharacterized protein n=1 Tax=Fasciola hepatica TaxID=6192 RepID=A0A4E0RE68_FASHE|nr:hypothetical protein D915_004380 [Fasciola hepatica]
MRFLPIRLIRPNDSIETYAFLDNRSNSTLLSSVAAQVLGKERPPKQLSVTSIARTTISTASKASYTTESLASDNRVQDKRVYSVKILQMRTASNPHKQLTCSRHLKGNKFESIENKRVGLLIVTNTPVTHWVQDLHARTSTRP